VCATELLDPASRQDFTRQDFKSMDAHADRRLVRDSSFNPGVIAISPDF
jgi:hypothetical protein